MPHKKALASDDAVALALAVAPGRGVAPRGVARGPLVRTRIAEPSNATSTEPSVSVR
jgi:hypothetical protein